MMLPLLTKIRILFFAESPSSAEAEVDPGEGWIVVAVLDGLVRVVLVLESHETVVVTEIQKINFCSMLQGIIHKCLASIEFILSLLHWCETG